MPEDFVGAIALLVGRVTDATLEAAAVLIAKYSKSVDVPELSVTVHHDSGRQIRRWITTLSAAGAD